MSASSQRALEEKLADKRLRDAAPDLLEAALPFATHDWMDADLEDDNCKLTRHSGLITVGHWRALRAAVVKATGKQP